MATTISTQDIIDAKRDIDDIGKAVNEKVIVSPRYGDDFKSLPMIADEFQISSDAAEAAAVSAAESANIAQSSANIAEAAATAATIGAGVFETPEAGVDPVTGVADGAYFNVRSSNDESYVDEYQNMGGVATPTGKSYPSAAYVQSVAKYTALPFVAGKTYALHERVQLENGDIVKSTIDGNTVNPNVDMTGWVNREKEQEEINYLIASEGVNILSVYGGVNDFGAAIELAYAKAMETDCRKIIIPDGVFSAKTTADLTLTSNFTLQFSGNTVINTDNRVDVINVTQGHHTLNVLGNGAAVYPNWSSGSNDVAALKLDSRTLGKSAYISDFNVYERGIKKFTNGINAIGLNYSTIVDCVMQAVNPIVNASALSGTDTHAMGTEVVRCKIFGSDTGVTLINNGELGCEGWKFVGGEYLCKTGIKVIDNLDSPSYYPPVLIIDSVHINAERFFSLSGISKVKISNSDLQSQVASNSPFQGLIEFDGIQVFDIDETTAIAQANTTGTAPTDSLPVFFLRNSAKAKTSAFLEFGIKNYWLQQNAPLIDFDTSVSLNGRVNFGKINTGAFTGIIVSEGNAKKVSVSAETMLNNAQVGPGVSTSADVAFDGGAGVLTFNSAPSFGSVYQVPTSILPDNATINQIKVSENIGKEFTIIVDASNVTINHSANLYTPIGVQNKLLYGSTLRVLSYNSDLCRILSVTNHSSILPATVPANTAAFGIHGQRVYSGGFVYEYFKGTGWVRWAASTF